MPKIIFRISKIKSNNILKATSHVDRKSIPANSDQRTPPTQLKGSGDSLKDIKALLPAAPRSNAVLALDFVLTASPNYFRPSSPADAGEWDASRLKVFIKEAQEWMDREFGQTLASAVLHLDESTPHIHGYLVPKRADGKLDAAKLYNAERLKSLQESAGEHFSKIGIKRGTKGSIAKHTAIKAFYNKVNTQPQENEIKVPPPPTKPALSIIELALQSVGIKSQAQIDFNLRFQKRQEMLKKRRERQEQINKINEKKAAFLDIAREQSSRTKAINSNVAVLRELDLDLVLSKLGATRAKKDNKNWNLNGERITVNGLKFFNHDRGTGGGGAIDLVKNAFVCDFKTATAWLAGCLGTEAITSDILAQTRKAIKSIQPIDKTPLPAPSDKNLHDVVSWLIDARHLKKNVIEEAIKQGSLYSDGLGNAVFLNKEKTGAEVRGKGAFKGFRGTKNAFFELDGTQGEVLVVESGTDALAARSMGFNGLVISSAGDFNLNLINRLEILSKDNKIFLGFDKDDSGNKKVLKVKTLCAGRFEVQECRPPSNCRDWKDALSLKVSSSSHAASSHSDSSPHPAPTM